MSSKNIVAKIMAASLFLYPLMAVSEPSNSKIPAAGAVSSVSISSMTGRQVLDEIVERHEKPYEFEIQKMTLIDSFGKEEKRELRKYVREVSDTETRAVSVFRAPSGVKGVAILTWQHDDNQDDQWLFLPSRGKKMKRIAKGGKKNYFMGTDYTYEDMVSESREKFSYERLADEEIDGKPYFVIKVVATDPQLASESGYSHRVLWVTQDTFVTVKVEFFDRDEKLVKRQTGADFKNIEGKAWRANKSVMEHLVTKHKTIVEIAERSFDESAVPEKNFRQRTITSGKILR